MKVKIQNLHEKKLRLVEYNVEISPYEIVEVEVNEAQIKNIQNTSFLEIVNENEVVEEKEKTKTKKR